MPVYAQQLKEITNSIGMKLVLIHAGSFMMGSPEEEEGRSKNELPYEATIRSSFYLGIYEVTQEQYEKVIGTNPSFCKGATRPVENVSWDAAYTFCKKLSEMQREKAAGREYRLPTEVEWEYACRAHSTTTFCFGNEEDGLEDFAWFGEDPATGCHAVGLKKANRWGLYDMHGNVCEWCQDPFDASAKDADAFRIDPSRGPAHMLRGGCYDFDATSCRSARRHFSSLDGGNVGFRVAMSLPGEKPGSAPSK